MTQALDLADALAQQVARGAWPEGSVTRVRDLLLIHAGPLSLVIACDSNASAGSKPADHLQQEPYLTGHSAAKVPLMEIIAAGASPLVLIDNLCCELEPTGRAILEGIERALGETTPGVILTGSDETNMPTTQTGVGITVIGVATLGALRLGTARGGDIVACVGTPRNGTTAPYREGDDDVAGIADITAVSDSGIAHELLPVGSRGVAYEASELSRTARLALELEPGTPIDLEISAGAGTCFLAALPEGDLAALAEQTRLPVTVVARLG